MTPIECVYESVKGRTSMTCAEFSDALKDWTVVPLEHRGTVIGGVLIKGNEIHIGCFPSPKASIRRHLKLTLKSLIEQFGKAVTVVEKENIKGLRFGRRLGFFVTREENNQIHMECRRCLYV